MRTTAAFMRTEGLFWPRGWPLVPVYLSLHDQRFRARALRLGLCVMLYQVAGLLSRHYRRIGTRAFHAILCGMSEDRVHVLGEELAREVLAARVLPGGRDVLWQARATRHRVVLLSDNIEEVVEPLAGSLGQIDEVVCNRLEYRHAVDRSVKQR